MTRTLRRALATGALAAAATLTLATPALAAPLVDVTGPGLAADAPTTVQLHGTGFQSVAGGFGGIYVLFGWVDDTGDWRPSAGGVSGTQYRYAVDVQGQENAGYQRFVAFPGSTTSIEANGGEVAADGSWSADLTVPGSTLTALDAAGGTVEVDCLQVTCGVITFGAHGVTNANNETFTPVAFAATEAAAPAAEPTTEPAAEPADASSAEPTAEVTAVAAPAPDDADGPGAAPWVVAGSAGAAAVGAAVAAVAGVRASRRRTAAEAAVAADGTATGGTTTAGTTAAGTTTEGTTTDGTGRDGAARTPDDQL